MDQPYYLLIAAGSLIVIISLFLKKSVPNQPDAQTFLVQKQLERTEMEKTLQRFVQQVKQENESVVVGVHRTKTDLTNEVTQLRERLQNAEEELSQLSKQVQGFQNQLQNRTVSRQTETEEAEEDILALRDRYRRVFELKQEGHHIDEIAKRIGVGRGEIELIFSLATPHERGSING